MYRLTLVWKGPFEMTIETPEWAEGKPGLFAITHDSSIVYIGKAQHGNAVFKEAKNRENKWIRCFKRAGILPEGIAPAVAHEYVNTHCRIYVAIVDDGQLRDIIGEAEERLIFNLQDQLICNSLIKNKSKLKRLSIVNSGNLPLGLPKTVYCTT